MEKSPSVLKDTLQIAGRHVTELTIKRRGNHSMAVTLRQLYEDVKQKEDITLVAGEQGLGTHGGGNGDFFFFGR